MAVFSCSSVSLICSSSCLIFWSRCSGVSFPNSLVFIPLRENPAILPSTCYMKTPQGKLSFYPIHIVRNAALGNLSYYQASVVRNIQLYDCTLLTNTIEEATLDYKISVSFYPSQFFPVNYKIILSFSPFSCYLKHPDR